MRGTAESNLRHGERRPRATRLLDDDPVVGPQRLSLERDTMKKANDSGAGLISANDTGRGDTLPRPVIGDVVVSKFGNRLSEVP